MHVKNNPSLGDSAVNNREAARLISASTPFAGKAFDVRVDGTRVRTPPPSPPTPSRTSSSGSLAFGGGQGCGAGEGAAVDALSCGGAGVEGWLPLGCGPWRAVGGVGRVGGG